MLFNSNMFIALATGSLGGIWDQKMNIPRALNEAKHCSIFFSRYEKNMAAVDDNTRMLTTIPISGITDHWHQLADDDILGVAGWIMMLIKNRFKFRF